ncbi:MAG: DUF87 domain-containing protein [Xanthomonadaceae bacterium]|nr:DUF87 domain-containing protein [Xanthomonadaceae bacterium]
MREFKEPTYNHLFSDPLILGVPGLALVLMISVSILFDCVLPSPANHWVSLIVAMCGYIALRLISKYASIGWEENVITWLERRLVRNLMPYQANFKSSNIKTVQIDTLTNDEIISKQRELLDRIIRSSESAETIHMFQVSKNGTKTLECIPAPHTAHSNASLSWKTGGAVSTHDHIYALKKLPTHSHPTWMSEVLTGLSKDVSLVIRVKKLVKSSIHQKLKNNRKRNFQHESKLTDVDSQAIFKETSAALEQLLHHGEQFFRVSVILISKEKLNLDSELFLKESEIELPVISALGLRSRSHRAIILRESNMMDCFPLFLDPVEFVSSKHFTTRRESPTPFNPANQSLDSLHTLVIGASGSGKSFFTGMMISELLKQDKKPSFLILDHHQGFKKFIESKSGIYLEPESIKQIPINLGNYLLPTYKPGTCVGIDFTLMPLEERQKTIRWLLTQIPIELKQRMASHTFYLVVDEAWSFLKDEPYLVQKTFREFRKLGGAVIAITQSLGDFISDQTGQAALQNSPTRIILRQQEDLSPYQGALNLNDKELELVRTLTTKRGEFSECIVKTPFESKLIRTYPTKEQHESLRTDRRNEASQ